MSFERNINMEPSFKDNVGGNLDDNDSFEQKAELVNINEKVYSFQHFLPGQPKGDVPRFVYEQWDKPREQYNDNLVKALNLRNVDSLTDDKNEIAAMTSYSAYTPDNEGGRKIMGDGNISMVLVREDLRTRGGIGSFLTKRAVDTILEVVEKSKGFKPPVVITAEADSAEGSALMKRIQQEYGDRVVFKVQERYLSGSELPKEIIPENFDNAGLDKLEAYINGLSSESNLGMNVIKELKENFFTAYFEDKYELLNPEQVKALRIYVQGFVLKQIVESLEESIEWSEKFKSKDTENIPRVKEIITKCNKHYSESTIAVQPFLDEKLQEVIDDIEYAIPEHIMPFLRGY